AMPARPTVAGRERRFSDGPAAPTIWTSIGRCIIACFLIHAVANERGLIFRPIVVQHELYRLECMRLILSRKGFDSKYGGCPSPILPGGTMFSLPITSDSGPHRLGQLNRGDLNFGDIARDLTQDRREASKRWGRGTAVHLDPDLDASVLRERAAGWTPSYGTVPPAL